MVRHPQPILGGLMKIVWTYFFRLPAFVTIAVSTVLASYCPGGPMCDAIFFDTVPAENGNTARIAFSRVVYHSSDRVAQAVVSFPNQRMTNLHIKLTLSSGSQIFTKVLDPCATPSRPSNSRSLILGTGTGGGVGLPHDCSLLNHIDLRVDLTQLSVGSWTLQAVGLNKAEIVFTGQPASSFTIDELVEAPVEFPADGVPIKLLPQSVMENATWGVSTGIPLPKGALNDLGELTLFESLGPGSGARAVPAQVTTRATWDVDGGVKWLGLDFVGKYDGTRPRSYRLFKQASAPIPGARIRVDEDANFIFVDTGFVKFRVNRKKFAGVDKAWFDPDGSGTYSDLGKMVDDAGGPYLVDSTDLGDAIYKAALDTTASVTVEEQGLVRATILAKGWYVREVPGAVVRSCPDANGNCLCQFVTRITAFAGQPLIRISHRTVLTYSTNDARVRIRDVGWQIAAANEPRAWEAGATGFQGRSHGPVPQIGQDAYVYQDRGDRVRIFESGSLIGTGLHSNGWLSSVGRAGRLTLMVRNVYQRFPKELEFSNDRNPTLNVSSSPSTPRLVLHQWPKHGVDCGADIGNCAFPDSVANTSPVNFYKFRYAHQGKTMQLKIPDGGPEDYINAFLAGIGSPNDGDSDGAGGGEVTSARFHTDGQGLALGADFAILFQAPAVGSSAVDSYAALFQEDPHAMAAPEWNASSNVLGRVGAVDWTSDPVGERALQIAMPGYQSGIVDAGGEFGTWIYGNIHDNWDPSAGGAVAHRVWSNSHYQNVWTDWLLYFRSGDKDALKWARATTEEWENVGTVNYSDGVISGRLAGYMYHVKGIVPWGGDSAIDQHWVNPSAYLLHYFLAGDRHALDLATSWRAALDQNSLIQATSPQPCVSIDPSTIDPITMIARSEQLPWIDAALRDRVNYFGELVDYYEATWSPQALLRIPAAATWINIPLECTAFAGPMPIWGRQWFLRYYELTRDPVVVDRLKCWYDSSGQGCSNYSGELNANTLLGTQHIGGQDIFVCIETLSGSPCSQPAAIFSDSDLRPEHALPNPFFADGEGRFFFFADPTQRYHLRISINGSVPSDVPNIKEPGKGSGGIQNSDFNVDAFLYHVTGDPSYLTRDMGQFYDVERIYYDNPTERYHGYGQWVQAENAVLLQEAPYYMQALRDAGLTPPQRDFVGQPQVRVAYPTRTHEQAPVFNGPPVPPFVTCPPGWSDSSTIVLALSPTSPNFNVTLSPQLNTGGQDWFSYFVFPPPPPLLSSCVDGSTPVPAGFPSGVIPNAANRTIFITCPSADCAGSSSGVYRIEARSKAVRFFAPYTDIPEAAVWIPTSGGGIGYLAFDRQLYYVRPNAPDGQPLVVRISAESQSPVSWSAMPVWYRIEDSFGNVIPNGEGRLFFFVSDANESTRTICLPPPPAGDAVYRLYTSSTYGPILDLMSGAEELLVSTKLDDLNAIYSNLPHGSLQVAACPSN